MSRFALSRRTTLTNFVFQLSKTEVQKYEDEKLRRSLEPAHTNDEKAYCKTYSVYHTNGVAIRRQQADTCWTSRVQQQQNVGRAWTRWKKVCWLWRTRVWAYLHVFSQCNAKARCGFSDCSILRCGAVSIFCVMPRCVEVLLKAKSSKTASNRTARQEKNAPW